MDIVRGVLLDGDDYKNANESSHWAAVRFTEILGYAYPGDGSRATLY